MHILIMSNQMNIKVGDNKLLTTIIKLVDDLSLQWHVLSDVRVAVSGSRAVLYELLLKLFNVSRETIKEGKMVDFSRMSDEAIVRNVRRKLYGIIYEHVKNFDDENTLSHVKNFIEGVSWATSLPCEVRGDGEVYVYLIKSAGGEGLCTEYKVIDLYIEIKILRNSINRHYYKQDKKNLKEVCFDVRN